MSGDEMDQAVFSVASDWRVFTAVYRTLGTLGQYRTDAGLRTPPEPTLKARLLLNKKDCQCRKGWHWKIRRRYNGCPKTYRLVRAPSSMPTNRSSSKSRARGCAETRFLMAHTVVCSLTLANRNEEQVGLLVHVLHDGADDVGVRRQGVGHRHGAEVDGRRALMPPSPRVGKMGL